MICPLCQSENVENKEIIDFDELKKIWQYGGVKIDKYLPSTIFSLKECQNCGLQFFKPRIAGSDEFYSALQGSSYYRFSWDHKIISDYILKLGVKSVLDYGSGEGLFLRKLPENILKIGIDFNMAPKDEKNLKLIKTNLLEFQPENKFESIVCVQTLEHLSEPKKHLEKMIGMLRENGYLFISVPNQQGILKCKNSERCLHF